MLPMSFNILEQMFTITKATKELVMHCVNTESKVVLGRCVSSLLTEVCTFSSLQTIKSQILNVLYPCNECPPKIF